MESSKGKQVSCCELQRTTEIVQLSSATAMSFRNFRVPGVWEIQRTGPSNCRSDWTRTKCRKPESKIRSSALIVASEATSGSNAQVCNTWWRKHRKPGTKIRISAIIPACEATSGTTAQSCNTWWSTKARLEGINFASKDKLESGARCD